MPYPEKEKYQTLENDLTGAKGELKLFRKRVLINILNHFTCSEQQNEISTY